MKKARLKLPEDSYFNHCISCSEMFLGQRYQLVCYKCKIQKLEEEKEICVAALNKLLKMNLEDEYSRVHAKHYIKLVLEKINEN